MMQVTGAAIQKGRIRQAEPLTQRSHTPVGVRLAANHRSGHLQCNENHRRRHGYVDNSLMRVPAHTHSPPTTAFSLQNPMVDPERPFLNQVARCPVMEQ
jgi:hypothetical protein